MKKIIAFILLSVLISIHANAEKYYVSNPDLVKLETTSDYKDTLYVQVTDSRVFPKKFTYDKYTWAIKNWFVKEVQQVFPQALVLAVDEKTQTNNHALIDINVNKFYSVANGMATVWRGYSDWDVTVLPQNQEKTTFHVEASDKGVNWVGSGSARSVFCNAYETAIAEMGGKLVSLIR